MRNVIAAVLLLLAGCATVSPDPSLVRWSHPNPDVAARVHADSIYGMYLVLAGSSMEPFLYAGDYLVADFTALFTSLRAGTLPVYDPNWADASIPLVCHMAVAKTGDCWVVRGINNRYSESGVNALCQTDYRATVVAIYTSRTKP